ncbi:MAG: hypothetical protein CM1200mP23_1610 [Nitrososphaerota archaeon]|nr:MAG: hypothetical protein CM1200mP23_1610 [Nitrososphaerota archaeon]
MVATRCASILRKIYLQGPITVNELRSIYGGSKPQGYGLLVTEMQVEQLLEMKFHGLEKLDSRKN